MPGAQPDIATPLRTVISAFADRRVAAGMWLTTLPSLLFGTVAVLAPLRLDELGAGSAAIAAVFLAGAAIEAGAAPVIGRLSDRRGRLIPCAIGVTGGGLAMAVLPWPDSAWVLGVLVVLACPAIGILYTPAMAMLSDGAEEFGIAQGFAFALVNLAWGTGQAVGDAGSATLAEELGDRVPYLILAAAAAATLAMLLRQLARRTPARPLASRA
jgi:MFS family permease